MTVQERAYMQIYGLEEKNRTGLDMFLSIQ
jgi:hypothetical protein